MVGIINAIVAWFQGLLSKALDLLPASPFQFDMARSSAISSVMGYVNYFFPVEYCLTVLGAWLLCIILWYVVSIALRWVKAIQ